MSISEEVSREERIKKEYSRLRRLLKSVPKEKLSAANGIIQRAAFMAITLEDLETDINENGTVEMFVQGDNEYERQRPAAQLYNTTVKNYTATCKQLTDLIPAGGPPEKKSPDEFEKIARRNQNG